MSKKTTPTDLHLDFNKAFYTAIDGLNEIERKFTESVDNGLIEKTEAIINIFKTIEEQRNNVLSVFPYYDEEKHKYTSKHSS